MNKAEKEFNEKFMASKAYDDWHESFNDIMDFVVELINPNNPKMPKELKKEKINELKSNHLWKSIALGLFFHEFIIIQEK